MDLAFNLWMYAAALAGGVVGRALTGKRPLVDGSVLVWAIVIGTAGILLFKWVGYK
jgi:hypothetical protein